MPLPDDDPVHPDLQALEPIKDVKMAPAHGIAALALNFALKYHDINTVQDGALYQQYKLEGKNLGALHLDHVFDTAVRIERHLLGGSERLAKIVTDVIADGLANEVADIVVEEAIEKKEDESK